MSIYLPPGPEQLVPAQYRDRQIAAELVIFRCDSPDPNGEGAVWEVVPPKEVPGWLKEHRIVRAMVNGQMVQKEYLDKRWYRAERVPPPDEAH